MNHVRLLAIGIVLMFALTGARRQRRVAPEQKPE